MCEEITIHRQSLSTKNLANSTNYMTFRSSKTRKGKTQFGDLILIFVAHAYLNNSFLTPKMSDLIWALDSVSGLKLDSVSEPELD